MRLYEDKVSYSGTESVKRKFYALEGLGSERWDFLFARGEFVLTLLSALKKKSPRWRGSFFSLLR